MPSDETRTSTSSGSESDPPVRWIGPYRLIQKIGEGGMGIVYEAEQTNPRRRVAVKVIRGGASIDEHQVRLFQREAQTLARLKHASIGSIYEAGRTPEGEHYFAMELVRGEPLHHFLARPPDSRDTPRSRMRVCFDLFLTLCDGVAYAHQRGVIHRDLKPSNVLVLADSTSTPSGSRPAPALKILDFGLARITDADVTLTTLGLEPGRIQGTLSYMSPEQARGNPDEIDVRSDVYSLGVILFEMLTGRLPYELKGLPVHAAIRDIIEKAPIRPGTMDANLRGDTETILLKALDKDPARRYPGVDAFAEDVRRMLENRPILAHPPSTIEALRKLVLRHRLAAGFGATLVALLIVFAISMSVMYGRQRVARSKAERINEFLEDMLRSADPEFGLGRDVLVRDVLETAAKSAQTDLAREPKVQNEIQRVIASTFNTLGLYDEAESTLRLVLARQEADVGDDDRDLARTRLEMSVVAWRKGELETAEALSRRALATFRATSRGPDPDAAEALRVLADVLNLRDELEESERCAREALAEVERSKGKATREYFGAVSDLATILYKRTKFAEAESTQREAIRLGATLHGEDHVAVARSMNGLASILRARSNFAEAESLYRRALAVQRQGFGEQHPTVASTLNNLGLLMKTTHRYAEAESMYRASLQIRREALGEEHFDVAQSLNNLGTLLRTMRRDVEAESLLSRALDLKRKAFGDDHSDVALVRHNLAGVYHSLHRDAEAESSLGEALRVRRKLFGDRHPDVALTLQGRGIIRFDAGRYREAESDLREALDIQREVYPVSDWRVASTESRLGRCLMKLERWSEAESLLARSVPILLDSPAAATSHRRTALEALVAAESTLGNGVATAAARAKLRELETAPATAVDGSATAN